MIAASLSMHGSEAQIKFTGELWLAAGDGLEPAPS